MGILGEGIAHQPGKVEGPEKTGAIWRQGLFAAGIGGVDMFGVIEVVQAVDAVDEDDARFRAGIGRAHDLIP